MLMEDTSRAMDAQDNWMNTTMKHLLDFADTVFESKIIEESGPGQKVISAADIGVLIRNLATSKATGIIVFT